MAQVVLTLGDDVSTDIIYPGRHMATVLPEETLQFAFADLQEFNARLRARQIAPGSVIVAGRNFGCGSSREQACSCLRGWELTIVAKDFARIFQQNAINVGLLLLTVPDIEAGVGDELELLPGRVVDGTTGKAFAVVPLPPARQAIVTAGGLIPYTRRRVLEAAKAGAARDSLEAEAFVQRALDV
jgi:3-isopropylmalate/(R)-2-methylmalate dehydratase small subunit